MSYWLAASQWSRPEPTSFVPENKITEKNRNQTGIIMRFLKIIVAFYVGNVFLHQIRAVEIWFFYSYKFYQQQLLAKTFMCHQQFCLIGKAYKGNDLENNGYELLVVNKLSINNYYNNPSQSTSVFFFLVQFSLFAYFILYKVFVCTYMFENYFCKR